MVGAFRRALLLVAVLVEVALVAGGCGSIERAGTVVGTATAEAEVATTVSAAGGPTTAAAREPTLITSAAPLRFEATVHEIDDATAARMEHSWREGCPVALEDLRLLELAHFDFAGAVQIGELVVNEDQVEETITVFERLFELQYPIDQMRLVDEFNGDDMLSMQANNTSAFNCRVVAGTNRWSEHAYGRAIDVNPLINPYVRGRRVSPPEGAVYVDRAQDVPGMIQDGDDVVAAFAEVGWSWGGYWASSKDYQHFSSNGR